MLFNSYIFILLFLPLALLGYFLLNRHGWHRAALCELILMSFVFYAYNNTKYLLILAVSILVNGSLAYFLHKMNDAEKFVGGGIKRKIILAAGIILNIGSIFYFKYFDFFIENMNKLISADFELRHVVLPLGISFYTFQQISYLIDSYRGETKDYTFLEYAAFVSFFPQLVAGPIVLHREIIPQFSDEKKWRFDHHNFAHGLYIFAIGLFKKVLIADTFGKAVSYGWENIETIVSMEIMIVMLSYTFQIYFDFSGYCDMAVGLGKMFRIELPVNFDSPYKSYSIIEFWKRWHMTLTRFLRNYVYFPLGGSRKGQIRTCINIMIVFLISGIWHGANWTFILWGALHGLAQVLNRLFKKTWDKCNPVFQWLCTFMFVNVMWLIFRADNVKQAVRIINRMFRMESSEIREQICNCFRLEEVDWIVQRIKPLSVFPDKIYGLYMWITLLGALFICLNLKNMHEVEFKPTVPKAILTSVLLAWSIMSFAGVSTFLYFNF